MVEVSAIVPVLNGQRTLEACLESLAALDGPFCEVIVVDDGSTDASLAVARRFERDDPRRFRVIAAEHGGPAAARNLGIRAATGHTIFFTDADVIVPQDWVQVMLRELDAHGAAAVAGGVQPAALGSRYEAAEDYRYWRAMGREPGFIDVAPTCNLAIKRSVLDAVGLFDEVFELAASEDYDLCLRVRAAGHRIWFQPACTILHQHPTSLRPIIKRGLMHGREHVRLMSKHGRDDLVSIIPPAIDVVLAAKTVVGSLRWGLWEMPPEIRWVVMAYDLAFSVGWYGGKVVLRADGSIPFDGSGSTHG